MANQPHIQGGRGTTLGLLFGHLRGGFSASVIPRSRQSSSGSLLEQATGSPLSPASGSETGREPPVVGCNTSVEEDVDNSSSVCQQLASMSSTLT